MCELQLPADVRGAFGRVFFSPMPYTEEPYDVIEAATRAGVTVVVNLATEQEAERQIGRTLDGEYAALGWTTVALPCIDGDAPEDDELAEGVATVEKALRDSRNVLVHCLIGRGRTGMFLACLVARLGGKNGAQALEYFAVEAPGVMLTGTQVRAVDRFVAR